MAAEYPAGGALPVAATAAIGLFDVRVCPLSAKLNSGQKTQQKRNGGKKSVQAGSAPRPPYERGSVAACVADDKKTTSTRVSAIARTPSFTARERETCGPPL